MKHGDRASPSNPFEQEKPRISEYTAQEIATLQSRLEKKLGPEYISSRAGPSGHKVHYLAGEKVIQLANEVFGFNGWSSSIIQIDVDFVDENPNTFRVNLGLSVIVRVTLRDGTFHEDIGYGHIENCKGKAAAFAKAKKEGTTDALKRALRNFGNVLGNCLADKDYMGKVMKVKVQPVKWDVENLHHAPGYGPSNSKKETAPQMIKGPESKPNSLGSEESIGDEFDDFDEADFGLGSDLDINPDEAVPPVSATSHNFDPNTGNQGNPESTTNSNAYSVNNFRGPTSRSLPMAAPARPQTTADSRPKPPAQLQQPQTPTNGVNGRFIPGPNNGPAVRPLGENGSLRAAQIPQTGPARVATLNQPSRTGYASVPTSPKKEFRPIEEGQGNQSAAPSFPTSDGPGFFSARAAIMMPAPQNPDAPLPPLPAGANLPAFNPNAESPSIRKTPGIDHKKSIPLGRDGKHVPGSTQSAASPAPSLQLPNVVYPQLNQARRVGAPASPSPMNRGGGFKAPGPVKRPVDGGAGARAPLNDLPANVPAENGGDTKRQRVG